MYLGDHRWSVSPPNQYLVTDGVYRRQTAALQTADCLWGLCLLRSPSAASLRGKTRPQLATPNPLFLKLTNHVAPRAASRTRSPRSTSISMETHTDEVWVVIPDRTDRREEGAEQVSPWWSGDRGILQRAAVAIETQNACHPMLSAIEMEEDSARELKSANADHWLVNQLVYWLKINLH